MTTTNVDTITDALSATNLQAQPDDATLSRAAEEGRRLYIGNLAYTTTEDQLMDFFKGYDVESVSIPVNPRTTRAVGYAFVDVQKKEDAENAIESLSGKEVLGRKVSVQIARKPGSAPATAGEGAGREGANGDRGNRRGRGGPRGNRGGRGGRGGKRRASSRGDKSEGENTSPTPNETTTPPPKKEAPVKEKKKKGPPENGVPSTTKVMVANLPYELGEEKLKEIFSAYDPEYAKIALRPIPRFMVRKLQARGEPRKGRGFGFVTLSSEEMQKKAVEEMNGKVIEGREIAVKVAIDNPRLEGDEGEESEEAGANGVKEEATA